MRLTCEVSKPSCSFPVSGIPAHPLIPSPNSHVGLPFVSTVYASCTWHQKSSLQISGNCVCLHFGQHFGALGDTDESSDCPVINEADTEGTEASEIQTEADGDVETSESVVGMPIRTKALVFFCDLCTRAPVATATLFEFLQALSFRGFSAGAPEVLAFSLAWDDSLFFHKAFLSLSVEQ